MFRALLLILCIGLSVQVEAQEKPTLTPKQIVTKLLRTKGCSKIKTSTYEGCDKGAHWKTLEVCPDDGRGWRSGSSACGTLRVRVEDRACSPYRYTQKEMTCTAGALHKALGTESDPGMQALVWEESHIHFYNRNGEWVEELGVRKLPSHWGYGEPVPWGQLGKAQQERCEEAYVRRLLKEAYETELSVTDQTPSAPLPPPVPLPTPKPTRPPKPDGWLEELEPVH